MVIAPDHFRDEEYLTPKRILEEQGVQVKTGSLTIGEAIGAGGARAQIDVLVSQVSPEDYDGVVFVGGSGMVNLVNNSEFTELARRFYEAKKLVAAICIAPALLANSGILTGKTATVWPEASQILEQAGAKYTGGNLEVDDILITANGPQAAEEFGRAIVKKLL